ncbi:MAG: NUDIX hydrolase [Candidatus Methylomirabilales bacterium]
MSKVRGSKSDVARKRTRTGPARLPIRHQVSSGGVIYRQGPEGLEIALIGLKAGTVWALPKGLVEHGEAPEETAVREVREETGLTGRCVGKVGEIEYWFVDREARQRIHKRVHFYLIEHMGGDMDRHDFEVEEVRWVPLKDALTRLSYRSERETVEKAGQMIRGETA